MNGAPEAQAWNEIKLSGVNEMNKMKFDEAMPERGLLAINYFKFANLKEFLAAAETHEWQWVGAASKWWSEVNWNVCRILVGLCGWPHSILLHSTFYLLVHSCFYFMACFYLLIMFPVQNFIKLCRKPIKKRTEFHVDKYKSS